MRSCFRRLVAGLTLLFTLCLAAQTQAQGLTGQITGAIKDAQQGVLPGATIVIRNTGTNVTRETVSAADGSFVFPDLLAGVYDLTASVSGFKTYEQRGIQLSATERIALRPIVLEVGQLSEQITVQADIALVQTTSAARSGLIDRELIDDVALKGRDFAGMLQLLPGVIDTRNREAPGWGSVGGLTINGRAGFNFAYDGVTNKDTGSNSGNYSAPALDSIAEVRVQTANFQAEYGRSSGATINVITRNGTSQFHGSAAYYKRDDAFNGNEFLRRQQKLDKPLYRFDNAAWTLGGPMLLPGGFNKQRDKLFFFWSQDVLQRTDPGALAQRRMPTPLERSGDFSQTFDAQGRLINIRDPLREGACSTTAGGPACFPGNIIPRERLDAIGLAMLGLLPMPNAIDPTGNLQYNHVFQTVQDWPRNDQVLRVDWNAAPNTTFYSRVQFGYEGRMGQSSFLGTTQGWPQLPSKYEIDTFGIVNTLLHTFNNTTFAEVTVGMNWAHQYTSPFDDAALDRNDRTKVLPGLPQFFPDANPLRLIPQATFSGGLPAPGGNIGQFNVEQRFPFWGRNSLWNVSANLTKVTGSHNLKTGLFFEHTTRPAARSSSFNGNFSFNTDASNPCNTNIGFANALLGCVTSYTESNAHPIAHGQFMNIEWFTQDNWRVRRNFSIDAGLRFYYIAPTQSQGDRVAMFDPARWSAGQAPALIQPIRVGNARLGYNPVTGQTVPAVWIGRLAEGRGDATNGMQVFDGTVYDAPAIQVAPRIGFAWDPTGDGKTAVRGGAGAFFDRFSDDTILSLVEMPPLLETRITNYTTIQQLLSSPLGASPRSVDYLPRFIPPVVYNWSIGVQRDIGFKLVADVAYVGNIARNQLVNNQINTRPYGYRFLPQNLDSTNVVAGQAQPLPDDFLRPYPGYASIRQREFSGYGDYHSLQVSVNRRVAQGLRWGASYTYATGHNLDTIDMWVPDNRARNYQRNARPHALVFNYSYDVPNLSRAWNHPVVAAVFDGWQVSGVTQMISGTPGDITYSFTNIPTGLLVGTGAFGNGQLVNSRPDIVCAVNIQGSERSYQRQFATECVKPPSDRYLLGNSTGDELLGPGYVNWDISFFKNIPVGGNRRLQFRMELYNAFNTDQWDQVDTSAVFDYQTGQQTDTAFGQLTGRTRDARRIQLGLRFTF